jgi:hypothetical protein
MLAATAALAHSVPFTHNFGQQNLDAIGISDEMPVTSMIAKYKVTLFQVIHCRNCNRFLPNASMGRAIQQIPAKKFKNCILKPANGIHFFIKLIYHANSLLQFNRLLLLHFSNLSQSISVFHPNF